jgi:predicted nucleotidyltransferase
MEIDRLLREKRDEILRIAARHGAYNVRIFGSAARGETGPESDVDILVDFEPGHSLLDRIGLMHDLEDLLGCEVDVATEKVLHEHIRDQVIEQAVLL